MNKYAVYFGKTGTSRLSQPLRRRLIVASTDTVKEVKWPTDEKGNIIWTLRRAQHSDTEFIVSHSDVLTPSLVDSLVDNSLESCLVAQIGETLVGYSLFAVERVPSEPEKEFGPLQTNALFVASYTSPKAPEEIAVKLVQGSLKTLKQKDCVFVSADVAEEDVEKAAFLEKCGFIRKNTVEKEGSNYIELYMNLLTSNVDPQKRIA
eukprot:jgi/Galph1/6088/GphlegSOOS_G4735.1